MLTMVTGRRGFTAVSGERAPALRWLRSRRLESLRGGSLRRRNWAIISALLISAATTGFGSGNFASSMTKLSW
jgi:hypothetical protein